MPHAKAVLGYVWAASASAVVLATFFAMEPLSRGLAAATGLSISAKYTGGDVAAATDHGTYRTIVHRTVFAGLLREPEKGFVQVDWAPVSALPGYIDEELDVLGDGHGRLRIALDTRTGRATLASQDPSVLGLELVSPLRGGWAVRISVANRRP